MIPGTTYNYVCTDLSSNILSYMMWGYNSLLIHLQFKAVAE